MTEDIRLEGDLADISLPTLLMSLYRQRETGILSFSRPTGEKRLFIKEGVLIQALSEDPEDGLGQWLFRSGEITLSQFLDAHDRLPRLQSWDRALLEIHAMAPEELVEHVNRHFHDLVFSLFLLKSGTYSLRLTSFSTLEMITLAAEIPTLVFEGMQRMKAWDDMHTTVGDPGKRLVAAPELPPYVADLVMDREAAHIFDLCKGTMPVSAILDASYCNAFETYRLLWIFLTLGLVVTAGEYDAVEPDAASPEALTALIERVNDKFAFIHRRLEAVPDALALFKRLLEDLSGTFPPFAPCREDLGSFGQLDPEVVLWNVRGVPENERPARLSAYLDEVLYAMVHASERHLPREDHLRVLEYVRKDGGHSLGVSP